MIHAFDTVILAGGVGSRLQSAVSDRPKCLAEINRRPFLSYLLDQLGRATIPNVILSTGHMAKQVEETFGLRYGPIQLHYSREETPLGTGGAVRRALASCAQDHVLVINGDSFLDFNCRDFFTWFDPDTMRVGMVAAWQDDCRRYGQIETGEDGQVFAFKEKNKAAGAGWINAGIYLIERSLLAGFTTEEKFSLERDFFPAQIGHGFYAQGFRNRFIDIGTPESYAAAGEFFAASPRR
jgi:D-glycero-alpha-D-manno-heptose 1-phosphate guanylyltransferase